MKKNYNNEYQVISTEKIYEPTGEFQDSGREVLFTRKKVIKYGKLTITVKSNEPSEEALKVANKLLNKYARKYSMKSKE